MGQGCYVASHTEEPAAAINTQKTKRVGGQMIVLQPTWAGAIINSTSGRSGIGILTATAIRAATTDIVFLGPYWPIPHNTDEHSQSLTAHLQHYMKEKEKNYRGSPLDWVKDITETEQSKHLKTPTNTCILAGDFNALCYPGRGGTNDPIQTRATLNKWRNSIGELLHNQNIKFATRYINYKGISTVDRILNSGSQSVLQAERLLISTDADIAELSDHRPIWAPYTVVGGRGTQGRIHKGKKAKKLQMLRPELTLKNKAEVQRYQDFMSKKLSAANLENMNPAEIIH